MFPILRPGDTLIVDKGPYRKPRIGHIILYRNGHLASDTVLTAHRIIARDPKGLLITKGDNLTSPDVGARLADEVIGRVVCIVRSGRIVPLNRGAPVWIERPMAYLSRINWTPGIVARRLKGLLGLRQ
ncbi:MAG: S24/S26 family peptidase [Deltaproteobacteria bacterium]|nr:S24/S26 family peptidase [Deltaproteobacteria bacterium]MBW2136909.1 S24/S26 family peptidase [Deltaproteobacteria bacterium]